MFSFKKTMRCKNQPIHHYLLCFIHPVHTASDGTLRRRDNIEKNRNAYHD